MELINKDGNISAIRNGKELICPFIQPTMQMDRLNQPKIIYPSCGSYCVHFDIQKQSDNKYNLEISCGGSPKKFFGLLLTGEKDQKSFQIIK